MHADRAFGGRLETGVRSVSISGSVSSVTIHVSFDKDFDAPPHVTVSPLDNLLGGKMFLPGIISNVTTTGFDITFASISGAAASGSSTFTYMAFGD